MNSFKLLTAMSSTLPHLVVLVICLEWKYEMTSNYVMLFQKLTNGDHYLRHIFFTVSNDYQENVVKKNSMLNQYERDFFKEGGSKWRGVFSISSHLSHSISPMRQQNRSF